MGIATGDSAVGARGSQRTANWSWKRLAKAPVGAYLGGVTDSDRIREAGSLEGERCHCQDRRVAACGIQRMTPWRAVDPWAQSPPL